MADLQVESKTMSSEKSIAVSKLQNLQGESNEISELGTLDRSEERRVSQAR